MRGLARGSERATRDRRGAVPTVDPGGTAARRAVRVAASAVALLATAAWGAPALAQPVQELDAGAFEIRADDRVVAVESFAIRREGSAVRAVGRIVPENGASAARTVEVRLQTNAAFRPNAYGLQALGGEVTRVDGTWEGDRLRLHVASTDGERWKEFLTPGSVAVLERGVAHHYYLLFRHLGADPAGRRVTVIVPSRHEQIGVAVSGGSREPVETSERHVEARRFELDGPDGWSASVWLDEEGGLVRVALPDGRVAVRRS